MAPTKLPIIGWPWELYKQKLEDIDDYLQGIFNKFQDGIFRTQMGTTTTIHINNHKFAEIILRDPKHSTKSNFYKYFEPCFGLGLLNSSGEKWNHDRKLMTPAFHFGILKEYSKVMIKKTILFNEFLEKKIQTIGNEYFDVYDSIANFSLSIIYETALGMSIDTYGDKEKDYTDAIRSVFDCVTSRIRQPWLKYDLIYYQTAEGKKFQAAVKIVDEKCLRVKEGSKKKALLDILFEANEREERPLTINEIRDHVKTFMAGIQNKIHQELDSVFGDSNETVTTDDIAKLHYLDRVIKEVLRLYPGGVRIGRYITEDVQLDKYTIPKGCNVMIHINQIHVDPKLWNDPKKFDPDRFLVEKTAKHHPFAYIPFSAGPRNCVGQKFANLEAKIGLAEIMRKWRVKSRDTHESIKTYSSIILRPIEGIFLKFEKRQNTK
ncbi:cytochrome P450 4C1-like [Aphidius gifuensis]|uniref:cytochrome P450 4C1-like n=1 Tax=Aphidius gifuensis TaxID=684658 RepID=UPI001CDC144B|nr:cytochrome P450 4C1-like [Aphidius gifuensis]